MGVLRGVTVAGILLLLPLTRTSQDGCPNMVSRVNWKARPPTETSALTVNPPTHVVIHHSATPGCLNENDCSTRVRSMQNYHVDNNKWEDIGYNFLVGEDGLVYEGRGWGEIGAHAPPYNSQSIGICFIGSFTDKLPNAKALQAAKDLISCGVAGEKIKTDYRLVGHRQVRATECPGNALYEEIKTWPNWVSDP